MGDEKEQRFKIFLRLWVQILLSNYGGIWYNIILSGIVAA